MPSFAQFPLEGIRRSQYAGSWYEADGHKLKQQLNDYLLQAQDSFNANQAEQSARVDQQVLALIAPHAGYMYSGGTAAFSYQFAREQKVQRVFLLGPSHHVNLHGVALPAAATFETPLGNLPVDKDTIAELKSYPLFCVEPEIHRIEHSLEMQLPFIRQAFGEVQLVPIVVGLLADEAEIRLIAEVLKGFVRKGDLVVVSSDFTHYGPRYSYQPFKTDMRNNIEKLDKEAFHFIAEKDVSGFLDFEERTHDTICGFYPCAILAAMLPDESRAALLKYATSQDTQGEDKHNSVSYLAITFSGGEWTDSQSGSASARDVVRLSEAEKRSLVQLARKTVEGFVSKGKSGNVDDYEVTITQGMRKCFGAFVTLYKKTSSVDQIVERTLHPDRELRGCVGSIWPVRPLYKAVEENAISACSRDYRFNPVKPDELNDIDIEISVLTPPRRIASYKDIVLGRDGIILSKFDKQAVFLPSVATEFGWTLEETLRQLSLKAGLKENDWQQGAKYDVFQSVSVEED